MKFKYFNWADELQTPLAYTEAEDYNEAIEKFTSKGYYMTDGDVQRIKEFTQPEPIPII